MTSLRIEAQKTRRPENGYHFQGQFSGTKDTRGSNEHKNFCREANLLAFKLVLNDYILVYQNINHSLNYYSLNYYSLNYYSLIIIHRIIIH